MKIFLSLVFFLIGGAFMNVITYTELYRSEIYGYPTEIKVNTAFAVIISALTGWWLGYMPEITNRISIYTWSGLFGCLTYMTAEAITFMLLSSGHNLNNGWLNAFSCLFFFGIGWVLTIYREVWQAETSHNPEYVIGKKMFMH